jgi:predicted phage terminase large subunit-like protein
MNIEDKVSGTGLIQTIKREGVPVIAIQRSTDKVTRAMDVAPSIEAGHVFLPMGREWLSDFLREHSQFPSSAHDDCVDPAIDAVYDMLVKTQYEAPTLIVGY